MPPTDCNRTRLADRRRITATPRLRAPASPDLNPDPQSPDSSTMLAAPAKSALAMQ